MPLGVGVGVGDGVTVGVGVAVGVAVGVGVTVGVTVGVGVGVAAMETSQIPRPCVAIRSTRLGFWIAASKTATRGKPLLKATHVAPPSTER